MTYLTQSEINVLAAVLGHTNMGHPMPDKDRVENLLQDPKMNVEQAVADISGYVMEGEHYYDIFIDEANGWVLQISQMNKFDLMSMWPDVAILVLGEEV